MLHFTGKISVEIKYTTICLDKDKNNNIKIQLDIDKDQLFLDK